MTTTTIEINKLELIFNHSMKNFCSFYFFTINEKIDRDRETGKRAEETHTHTQQLFLSNFNLTD